MDLNQFAQILLAASSPDPRVRTQGSEILEKLLKDNFAALMHMLAAELAADGQPAEARRLAGLTLKNQLTAKEDARKTEFKTRWLGVDAQTRVQVKGYTLHTLQSQVAEARSAAAQVVSAIAQIELPSGQWPDLITTLLNNMNQPNDFLRQASLMSLGYICEEIDASVLKSQSNPILTAVCTKGMKDPNPEIKKVACKALCNSLSFASSNMENQVERDFIMTVICECCTSPELDVRRNALECLVKVADDYYDKLDKYMQTIFSLTIEIIKKDKEDSVLQAIEFWSTICDVEQDLMESAEEAAKRGQKPTIASRNYIRGALVYLVPYLLEGLTKQQDEPDDEEEWNVPMASGTCVSLVANIAKDDIVPVVVPFIEGNVKHASWKNREAATLAFGAVLDGPRTTSVVGLIQAALPVFLEQLKDQSVYVRDTAAWTIGRICQFHVKAVDRLFDNVISALFTCLDESPKVANNCAWAIHNLAESIEGGKDTSPLSRIFVPLLEKLLKTAERADADEDNLRISVYEAVNQLISNSANDVRPLIVQLTPHFINRLDQTFQKQGLTQEEREEIAEIQSQLCAALTAITQKVGKDIKPMAELIMKLYIRVLSIKSASIHEEALMGVGHLANALEADFEPFVALAMPFILVGLSNFAEAQECQITVGVVGDIARAIGPKLLPYCENIIRILLAGLGNRELNRDVKPSILATFGDVALAIGEQFVNYLQPVMTMLQQASLTVVDKNDPDLVDYLNDLREGIFEGLTGIVQGMRGERGTPQLHPYVQHIVKFVEFVAADETRNDAVTRGALGVLGDFALAIGPQLKTVVSLQHPYVQKLVIDCRNSESESTKDVATWVQDVLQKL